MIGSRRPVEQSQNFQITLSHAGPADRGRAVREHHPQGRRRRPRDAGSRTSARVELGPKNQDVERAVRRQATRSFWRSSSCPTPTPWNCTTRSWPRWTSSARAFPKGVDYEVAFDTTPYTRESIHEVFKTLRDAIILVAIVVLVFLQNWRSAIIPLVAVPVAIIGTFAAMAVLGFSLNNLTLFGLVLAIGIVVDDAIVVVEAVEHHIEHGLAPREATILAMQQVSGPVIAVGLVLSAVFVPCAFISGITGQFFRQFALTIAVSTIISAFNSLTLSPALTAVLLRPRDKARGAAAAAGWPLRWRPVGQPGTGAPPSGAGFRREPRGSSGHALGDGGRDRTGPGRGRGRLVRGRSWLNAAARLEFSRFQRGVSILARGSIRRFVGLTLACVSAGAGRCMWACSV